MVPPGKTMARKTRQIETRMVSEYLKSNYSKFPYQMNIPLGPVSEELLKREGYERGLRIMRPYRPAVDAIVYLPRHLLLIEAKVWNFVDGLAKLPLYKSLIPVTPELQKYLPRAVIMQLVVDQVTPSLEVMARDAGVSLKLFCPDWLKEVREEMNKYWTPEYQRKRQEALRMREYFGVE